LIITHKLKMNLEEGDVTQKLEMPQGDVCTRKIEMHLYANQKAWTVPQDAAVLIRYQKPDGTVGEYDTLPDGTPAWSASDNVLSLLLAPQVLTAAGNVRIYAVLYQEEKVLHTFAVEICVKALFAGGQTVASEDYFYAANVLRGPVMAREGQILTAGRVDAAGRVIQVQVCDAAALVNENGSAVLHKTQNLREDQKIQARANIGAASKESVDFLFSKFTDTGIALSDYRTGEKYVLYIRNGKLIMEKE